MDLRSAAHRYLDVRSESGNELNFICPVHDDSHPSARGNVVKNVWVCFSCRASGKLETMLKEIAGGHLTISNEVDVTTLEQVEIDEVRDHLYHRESWLDQFEGDDTYWREERKLKRSTIQRFRLGFDFEAGYPVYPVRDYRGRVLGVTHRRTERWARPKYLYPENVNVHAHLFGMYEARKVHGTCSTVFLTEGAIDAMALWEVGVVALGMYGSKLSQEQVDLLRKLGVSIVVLAFDDDEAGDKAIWGWRTSSGKYIPGAVHMLRGMIVETVDWSLLRGPERPRSKFRQLDPASLSERKRRELVASPLSLAQA